MATSIQFNAIDKPEIEYYPKSFSPVKNIKTGSTQLLDSEVFYTLYKEHLEKGTSKNPSISDDTYNLMADCYYMHTEEGLSFRDIQTIIKPNIKYA